MDSNLRKLVKGKIGESPWHVKPFTFRQKMEDSDSLI
jgi:hypothetical protein